METEGTWSQSMRSVAQQICNDLRDLAQLALAGQDVEAGLQDIRTSVLWLLGDEDTTNLVVDSGWRDAILFAKRQA